jgi:glycosyltransferase involved in cell wall biosynthesis
MHSDTLRIAFATQEYVTEPSFDSGIANYVYRTATALARLGHDVHVLTLSTIDESKFRHDGVTVHRVAFCRRWLQLNRLTRYKLSGTMHLLALSASVYRQLKRLHREAAFDVVQFPNCGVCGLLSIIFSRIPQVLRASWYHPAWTECEPVGNRLDAYVISLLERFQLNVSRHIYSPSFTLRKMLIDRAKVKTVPVIPTPCYLEAERWDSSIYDVNLKGKTYLLFFGRFQLRKGFHLVAEALPRFLAAYPDAYAVFVGRDGPAQTGLSMSNYARRLCGRFRSRLICIDALPHRQLYPIISGARLVVLPSLVDNLPNACLEAMALAKVVIGGAGASFDELIEDGLTGFLVPSKDSSSLAARLIEIWQRPDLSEIGAAARRRMSDFAPEKTVPMLLEYFRNTVARTLAETKKAKEPAASLRPALFSRHPF